MSTVEEEYFRLDRVIRHGEESIIRMKSKIANTIGTPYHNRAVTRLKKFEATMEEDVRRLRAKIYKKEKPRVKWEERPTVKSGKAKNFPRGPMR